MRQSRYVPGHHQQVPGAAGTVDHEVLEHGLARDMVAELPGKEAATRGQFDAHVIRIALRSTRRSQVQG